MNDRVQIRMLPDGRRLHLHDGPIDLIVEAVGEPHEVEAAYLAAGGRFRTILDELCEELVILRQACSADAPWPRGSVARRMLAAVIPYAAEYFITPMAAVAGAVAEEILAAMTVAAALARAYVNNGGDIAFHLNAGEQFVVGMVERPDRPSLFGTADAVTVLADRAAAADAAATIIANAVDLPGHPAIDRVPACELAPDSDLGNQLVTQTVRDLNAQEVDQALLSGMRTAELLLRIGLIRSAALSLAGETRIVGDICETRVLATRVERGLVYA
jgi:ApbE superfamily uncharacterized protein (UPF0280 family)